MVGQQQDIFTSVAQWWNVDFHGIDTEQQVLTEVPFVHHLMDIGICGTNQTYIDGSRSCGSHPSDLPLLDSGQQLALHGQGEIAYLIQEERTSRCHLHVYTGQAIGGFGATLAAALSWQQAFHWFGIVGVIYAIVLMLFLYEKPNHIKEKPAPEAAVKKGNPFAGLGIVLTNWAFWVILFYFAAPSLPGWATKNWLPTLFAESLNIPMSEAGPISTITIALSSFVGVIVGGILSDKWVQKNIRGRVYTGAIGLGMTIPALALLGFGSSFLAVVGAGMLFGIGYGIFDANNMPILCQFISAKYRATAYGVMNMVGVFAGAAVTQVLGAWTDGGNLGMGFAMLSIVVAAALALQLFCLKPTTDNME